ncbi:hypothetical protein VNO78_23056 [Psophocarpus tetragonolobus]|uniref:RING-type domain-containing protein n=1 Tax=Psophocarpus tetragonolobus TaxID=3891 RepID=A0AAN9XD84_PSOTE
MVWLRLSLLHWEFIDKYSTPFGLKLGCLAHICLHQPHFVANGLGYSGTGSSQKTSLHKSGENSIPSGEMGDTQGPIIVSAPPWEKTSTSMVYYGLIVVGVAAMSLAVYNLIMVRRSRRGVEGRIKGCQRNLKMVSSFKYKKEGYENDGECTVCLSGFEEGEQVKKLPRCNHCFHAPCIDMWLYSHFDCPICRTPVAHHE